VTVAAPWRLVAAQVVCIAVVVASAEVLAGRASVGDQLLWVEVAVAAAVVSGALNGLWVIGLRRAVAARRAAVLNGLDAAADRDGIEPVTAATRTRERAEPLVAIRGMTLVHRSVCPLVAGKHVRATKAGEPCGWCRP
jgi:hypothetical protein